MTLSIQEKFRQDQSNKLQNRDYWELSLNLKVKMYKTSFEFKGLVFYVLYFKKKKKTYFS